MGAAQYATAVNRIQRVSVPVRASDPTMLSLSVDSGGEAARAVHSDRRAGAQSDLVARVRKGDRTALTVIFRAYYIGLCEFASRYVRSDDLAEELVQDVFAAIWSHRDAWVVRDTVRSYLYGAVRNRALRASTRAATAQRWAEATAREADVPMSASRPDADLDASELAIALQQALGRLPARRREAYILRREHGLSTIETAAIMGVSPKTVEMHLCRALRVLRNELGGLLSRPSPPRTAGNADSEEIDEGV